jgi:isopenicillin N synthase-like dioxygenase
MRKTDAADPWASNVGRAALPVIDLAAPGTTEPVGHRHVVDSLRRACASRGFFYLVGHGVPGEVLVRVMAASRRFFAADEQIKDGVAAVRLGGLGYRRMGGRRLDGSTGAPVKEEYYCARDDVPGLDDVNRWPSVSDFRSAMTEYLEHMHELARQVMSLLAETMGLEPDHFDEFCREPLATLRLVRYPAEGAEAGAHSDFGALTFLLQDGQGGLQVFDPATGGWIHAEPIPGSFVVNLGDLFEVFTDGAYPSTPHRVVHPPGTERFSVPFFFSGAADATVECLPPFRRPGAAPRFAATTPQGNLSAGHEAQGF